MQNSKLSECRLSKTEKGFVAFSNFSRVNHKVRLAAKMKVAIFVGILMLGILIKSSSQSSVKAPPLAAGCTEESNDESSESESIEEKKQIKLDHKSDDTLSSNMADVGVGIGTQLPQRTRKNGMFARQRPQGHDDLQPSEGLKEFVITRHSKSTRSRVPAIPILDLKTSDHVYFGDEIDWTVYKTQEGLTRIGTDQNGEVVVRLVRSNYGEDENLVTSAPATRRHPPPYSRRYSWDDESEEDYWSPRIASTTPAPVDYLSSTTRLPFTATFRTCQMGADCYKKFYYYYLNRQY